MTHAQTSPAAFDPDEIEQIWPQYRWKCLLSDLSGWERGLPLELRVLDRHHVLGRGGGEPMFSSPYNCAPLLRKFHRPELVDHRHVTAFLLEKVQRVVDEAFRDGRYQPTLEQQDRNAAFLEHAREWGYKHFPTSA